MDSIQVTRDREAAGSFRFSCEHTQEKLTDARELINNILSVNCVEDMTSVIQANKNKWAIKDAEDHHILFLNNCLSKVSAYQDSVENDTLRPIKN